MSEKVTKRDKEDIEIDGVGRIVIAYNSRMRSVMEMYRWLKEEIKTGRDEEELEMAWNMLRDMERAKEKLP